VEALAASRQRLTVSVLNRHELATHLRDQS
jgi:hypothetical protein